MKKSLLLGLGIATLALGGAAFGAKAIASKNTVESQATKISVRGHDYFTAGDNLFIQVKSSWSEASAKFALYFEGAEATAKWSEYFTVASNKVAFSTYDYLVFTLPSGFTDHYTSVSLGRFDPERAAAPSTEGDGRWGNTGAITGATASNNCIWLPNSHDDTGGGWMAYTDYYQISDGTTTGIMLFNNSSEVKYTFTTVAGRTLSVTYGNDENPGTLVPQNKPSNNLTSDYKIKVGGEVTVYLARDGWSTWVEGYKPSSIKLQNFCDYLLQNTISESTCSAPTGDRLTNLTKMWDGSYTADTNYALGDEERTAFKAVSPNYGNDVAYTSVVQEAITRYCHLVSAYSMVDFAGVNPSAYVSNSTYATNNSGTVGIVITIVAFSIIASLAFVFISKKRRHN